MPIVSDLSISSAVYDSGTLTVVGVAFSENQFDGGVYVSSDGIVYVEADTYDSWGDSQIVCSFSSPLAGGNYSVKVINGDNEEVIASGDDGFGISMGGGAIGVAINCGMI